MPPTNAEPALTAGPVTGPEQIVYRRRQSDWLSNASSPAGAGEGPGAAARGAAIELAKAALIARDGSTSDHSDDVGLLCDAIGKHFGLADLERTNLMAAAQLHDIGKVAVPETILQKPGPLTEAEWEVMRQHTPVGAEILNAVPELRDVAVIVRHSHEHWDGSGYPDGLSGDEIPVESRIILCADAFHAVRSPRPYRAGRSAEQAVEEIKANSGGQFDPRVVTALVRTVEELRVGRRAGRFSSVRTAPGSRRLGVLLLAMTMAGSAFAALRGPLWREGEAEAESSQATLAQPSPHRRPFQPARAASPARDAQSASGRARPNPAREARSATPDKRAAGGTKRSPRSPAARGRTVPAAPTPAAPGRAPSPAAPQRGDHEGKKDKGGEVPRGHAYGHYKRPLKPHPPPGRVKPKPER